MVTLFLRSGRRLRRQTGLTVIFGLLLAAVVLGAFASLAAPHSRASVRLDGGVPAVGQSPGSLPPTAIVPALAVGPCSLIQSDFMAGGHGNFEAVVLEGRNLVHYFHVNDDVSKPWSRAQIITTRATGPGCIIQSDFMAGGHGNFEVVALEGNELVHYFRVNADILTPWQRGQVITAQASGPGCIIQSDFMAGGHGNFEVVVQEGANLVHYFHINDNVGNPWLRGPVISTQVTGPASLLQSDFKAGVNGNLEVVAPEGNLLVHYFFTNFGAGWAWHRGQTLTDRADGWAAFIQGDFLAGGHGNFEVIAGVADANGCRTAAPCIRHYFHVNDDVSAPWQPGQVVAYTGRSRKVCQLTGDFDREWGYQTVNRTTQADIWGTDLGQPVAHKGRIFYFFGDTVTTRPPDQSNWNQDSYASSTDFTPENCLHLDFLTEDDGRFRPLTIPGVSLEAFETPTGGFSANGSLYLFAASGWNGRDHARSVLARSLDDGLTFAAMGDVSNDKFINISPTVVDSAQWPGLPQAGAGVLLWASGRYRSDDVYLAYLPLAAADGNPRPFLRYLAGVEPLAGRPIWASSEAAARPLFRQPCVGELSVVWNPFVERWLMLYNCGDPRGINVRAARQPWGPWSEPGVIFEPRVDGGYCHFIHDGAGHCDGVSDPGREGEFGGEYGSYVIAPLMTGAGGETTIYFTLSTWNPYEVMLMRATLRVDEGPPSSPRLHFLPLLAR